jgi:hypothetical protein
MPSAPGLEVRAFLCGGLRASVGATYGLMTWAIRCFRLYVVCEFMWLESATRVSREEDRMTSAFGTRRGSRGSL